MRNSTSQERAHIWACVFKHLVDPTEISTFPNFFTQAHWLNFDPFGSDFSDEDSFMSDEDDFGMPFFFEHHHHFRRSHRPLGQAMTLMLVCKEWLEVAQRVTCEELTFRARRSRVANFLKLVEARPELARSVSTLTISLSDTHGNMDREHDFATSKQAATEALEALLLRLPNIRSASCDTGNALPTKAFESLGTAAGGMVCEMNRLALDGTTTVAAFSKFTALRTLRLSTVHGTSAQFSDLHKLTTGGAEGRPCLPSLEHLAIDSTGSGLFVALAMCEYVILSRPLVYHWLTSSQAPCTEKSQGRMQLQRLSARHLQHRARPTEVPRTAWLKSYPRVRR